MEIIHAFWEKRNLDVNTYEIILEPHDDLELIKAKIYELKDAEYIVAKLPYINSKLSLYMNEIGFYFAESIIKIGIAVKDYFVPLKFKKIDGLISYKLANELRINYICKKIEENIFNTDRIALDHKFGIEKANVRYSNWLRDEYRENTSKIYELYIGERCLGFFGLKKKSEQISEIFLAGIFNDTKDLGLGFGMITKSIEEARANGFKYLNTQVSSNNLDVIRLYVLLGFYPHNIKHIFIKHCKN